MANLKVDIINKISNDKYFAELELQRLLDSNDISHQNKIERMVEQFSKIENYNSSIKLVGFYLRSQDETPQQEMSAESAVNPVDGLKL